jgi:CHAD domain-containing protein
MVPGGTILSATTMALDPLHEASAEHREDRARLERLMRDRLRKFMSLLPKVLVKDAPDAVHDLRVWSRRLQQVVAALSPDPLPPEAWTMVRALRRARRSLGGWRDCDVLIALLERRAGRFRNPEEKRACDMIRDLAVSKRARHMRRARRRLANRKLFTLAYRTQKFLQELSHDEHLDARQVLGCSVGGGYSQWRQALSRACDSFNPADIHDFRIQTKRLRYQIELTRDLDTSSDTEGSLGFLKSLQDGLGCWHDHVELARLTAEALANPDFLLKQARLAAALLRKTDREQAVQEKRVRRMLTNTHDTVEGSALDDWVARYCRELTIPTGHKESALPSNEPAALNGAGHASAREVAQVQTSPPACPTENFVKVVSGLAL